jgi:hypothetical protein
MKITKKVISTYTLEIDQYQLDVILGLLKTYSGYAKATATYLAMEIEKAKHSAGEEN